MLTFYISYTGGERERAENVFSAMLDCDLDVPADNLTLVVPFSDRIRREAVFITAEDGGKIIFCGDIDEITCVRRVGTSAVRLRARSLAARLLDNEATPLDYNIPSSKFMEEKFLKPFGLSAADADNCILHDRLRVDKGMSQWQVLRAFCKKQYGTEPRVSGETVYFRGLPGEGIAVFGDGGIGCYDITERLKRYKLITEVRVRMKKTSAYDSYVKNGDPRCAGLKRVRCVDATSDNKSLDTALKMISDGNRKSYALTLKCVGLHAGLLGKKAVVRDSLLGETSNLIVKSVRCTLGSSGEHSELILEKEDCKCG